MPRDRQKLIAAGRCATCAELRGKEGTSRLCRGCADRASESQKRRRVRLKSAGLCVHCGKRSASTKTTCDVCRQPKLKYALVSGAKRRARQKGLDFSLAVSDLEWPERCPVLDVPLDYMGRRGKYNPNSPSLDRIIPERGYVKGNVVVISVRANTIKNNATVEELRRIAKWLEEQLS